MRRGLRQFARDESGLELVEYAIVMALIVTGAMGAISALAGEIDQTFGNLRAALTGEGGGMGHGGRPDEPGPPIEPPGLEDGQE